MLWYYVWIAIKGWVETSTRWRLAAVFIMGNGQIWSDTTRKPGVMAKQRMSHMAHEHNILPFNWKSKPWTFSCPQVCIDRRMGRMGGRNGRTFLMFPDTESWNLTCVTGLILCSYMDLFNERMTLHEAGSRPEECQCPFHNLEAEFGIQDDWALNQIESIQKFQNTSQGSSNSADDLYIYARTWG